MFLDMIRRVKADCRTDDIGLGKQGCQRTRFEADEKHGPLRHQSQNAYADAT